MKVLFAHDHYFLDAGGVVYSQIYPHLIWQRYLQHFDGITVVGRRAAQNTTVRGLSVSSGPGVSFVFGENVASLRSIFRTRARERQRLIDMLGSHDAVIARLPSEYGLLAIDAAATCHKVCLVEVVGCAWDALWNYGTFTAKAYAPLMYARMRAAVGKARFVLYVSQSFLQGRYPHGAEANTAAVSNVEITSASDEVLHSRLARIASKTGPTIFGLIGSLKARYKGVQTALEALAGLSKVRSDFAFRVLGGGDARKYVAIAERLGIGEKVTFDGTLPGGAAVMDWLDRIDVYLQPSFQEGVPRALIEAMSRGCPALGSTAGGIPELLDPSCMFAPGRSGAMARLLERSFDREWRREQALRNFRVSKNYTKDILDQRRTKLLEQFAAHARASSTSASAPL